MLGLSFSLAAAQADEHVAVLTGTVAMPRWDGVSVTVERYGNGRAAAATEGPTVYRDLIQIDSAAPNRLFASSQKLTGFSIFALPYLLGATIDLYRIRDGALSHVRRSTVTGGKIDRWNEVNLQDAPKGGPKGGKKKGGKKAAPQGSLLIGAVAYDHAFAGFNRAGAPYWFCVAAVDAAGGIGPKSAAVRVQPRVTKGKGRAANRTVAGPALTDAAGTLGAPSGLAAASAPDAPNVARLTWEAVAGAAGYIVYLAFADPATAIAEHPYLDLSDDPEPLRAGDVAILSKKFLTQTPDEINPRVWGTNYWAAAVPGLVSNRQNDPALGTRWQWMRFDDADPKPAAYLGDWFMRRVVDPGVTLKDGRYFTAGLSQSFYPTLVPGRRWRWRMRMRADQPVKVTLTLPYGLASPSFLLTTDWQDCIHEFSVADLDLAARPGNWRIAVTAGNRPLLLDYCEAELGEADVPLYVDSFPIARGTFVRDHTQIKPGNSTADADTLTNISGQGARVTTLHTLRKICEQFEARPWIQIEWHLPREDWLDIVAYLAAPVASGHPMALKRAAQGHAAPWTDRFDRIVFEFGNESWNRGIAAFWATPAMPGNGSGGGDGGLVRAGEVYGLWCAMITDWMAQSPFWPALEARCEWFLGGWARGEHGTLAATKFPRARYVGIAAYNGGWDEGGRNPREQGGFFSTLLGYAPLNGARGYALLVERTRAAAAATGRNYGTDLIPAIYEAGPGYQVSGLNGKEVSDDESVIQEVVMKSRASGTAAVDNFLMSAEFGLWGANYFRIGRGNGWNSTMFNGHADVDVPAYTLPRLITEQIAPAQVYSVQAFRPLQHRLPDREGTLTVVNSAAVYALRALETPSDWLLVFLNRLIDPALLDPGDPDHRTDRPNAVTVTLRTNWTRIGTLTEWVNEGNFREHNRYPPGQRLSAAGGFVPDPLCVAIDFPARALALPAAPGLLSATLGAGSCRIWKLTGVS